MSRALPRWLCAGLTRTLLTLAQALLPSRQADWARAMRAEVLAIDDAQDALIYAWGCFTAALHLATCRAVGSLSEPDHLGLACAGLVVGLGGTFMATRDAPSGYAWVNGLSLALACASFWLLPRPRLQQDARWRAATTFALGAALLWASAPQADGAAPTGWLRLGPLPVQATWLLCPAWWAVSASVAGASPQPLALRALQLTGLAMGLFALAAQAQAPLLAVTAVLLAMRAARARSGALAALALLAVALAPAAQARWTAPPPSPYVDEVLQLAFMHSAALGGLMTAAWLTLLLPGLLHRRAREHGLAWAALLGLALPGWLPAPVLGFGGSFIVGYVLSLALLPGGPATASRRPRVSSAPPHTRRAPPLPRAGLA